MCPSLENTHLSSAHFSFLFRKYLTSALRLNFLKIVQINTINAHILLINAKSLVALHLNPMIKFQRTHRPLTIKVILKEKGISMMKSKFTALLLALFMVFMPLAGIVRADEKDDGAKNFVNRCYQIALGRDADEDGFNFWLGQLNDGKLTGTGTALLFITSEE